MEQGSSSPIGASRHQPLTTGAILGYAGLAVAIAALAMLGAARHYPRVLGDSSWSQNATLSGAVAGVSLLGLGGVLLQDWKNRYAKGAVLAVLLVGLVFGTATTGLTCHLGRLGQFDEQHALPIVDKMELAAIIGAPIGGGVALLGLALHKHRQRRQPITSP
jgi:uncharacterized membrane protein